jgi:cytochrome c biogenesis protein CcdA
MTDAIDQILLLIAFAAGFGIAVCLLALLVDYMQHRKASNSSERLPLRTRSRSLANHHSSERAA